MQILPLAFMDSCPYPVHIRRPPSLSFPRPMPTEMEGKSKGKELIEPCKKNIVNFRVTQDS
jgi:hypothetical protein